MDWNWPGSLGTIQDDLKAAIPSNFVEDSRFDHSENHLATAHGLVKNQLKGILRKNLIGDQINPLAEIHFDNIHLSNKGSIKLHPYTCYFNFKNFWLQRL